MRLICYKKIFKVKKMASFGSCDFKTNPPVWDWDSGFRGIDLFDGWVDIDISGMQLVNNNLEYSGASI